MSECRAPPPPCADFSSEYSQRGGSAEVPEQATASISLLDDVEQNAFLPG